MTDEPQDTKPRLGQQQMQVTMDDGAEHTVWVGSADMAKWDRERFKRGWPSMEDVPALWMQFVTWSALVRQGLIPATPYDDFEERASVVPVVADSPVFPTNPGPGLG